MQNSNTNGKHIKKQINEKNHKQIKKINEYKINTKHKNNNNNIQRVCKQKKIEKTYNNKKKKKCREGKNKKNTHAHTYAKEIETLTTT